MADLVMIVPSRGRPANVAALLEAWAATSTGQADLLIALDDNDPALPEYKALRLPATWDSHRLGMPRWVIQERLRLGGTLNAVGVNLARTHRAVGFMGDDHRPRTVGWDARYVKALDELDVGLVYGNDLLQREALPTQVAMSSLIITALGYMVPPGMVHMYLDNFWLELGRHLGRLTYLPDVVIEHLHPVAGKAAWDDGYREVNTDAMFDEDRARFEAWRQGRMRADVDRILHVWKEEPR